LKIRITDINPKAAAALPDHKADGSGVGVNYTDLYLKSFKWTLEDGRKISCKRRGLKLTMKIGSESGTGLLRRIENGPDVRTMVRLALEEAARELGASFSEEDGGLHLELG
jgi:hypothetical protein